MTFKEALSHRSFLTLVTARAVSKIGNSLHEIALVWLVLQQTGDARLVTLVVVASTAPNLLLSLPAGAIVDRVDRRRVLIVADLLRGVAVLAIPVFGRGELLVPVAVGVALFVGLIEPFSGPARTATLPRTVPEDQLDSANALFSLTSSVSRTLYVLGGGVVAFLGAFPAFYIDSATFLASGALLWFLPRDVGEVERDEEPEGLLAETKSVLGEARDGFSYLVGTPVVLSIVVVGTLVGALSDPLGVITPVFVDTELNRGSVVYGVLFGSIFVGSTVGDLAVDRIEAFIRRTRGYFVGVSLAVGGIALSVAGVAGTLSPFPVATVTGAFFVFGVSLSLTTTPLDTLFQTAVPNEMLGRVSSVFTVVGLVLPPLALAATGPLIELVGVRTVLIADGLLTVLAAGLVTVPLVRHTTQTDTPVPGD